MQKYRQFKFPFFVAVFIVLNRGMIMKKGACTFTCLYHLLLDHGYIDNNSFAATRWSHDVFSLHMIRGVLTASILFFSSLVSSLCTLCECLGRCF